MKIITQRLIIKNWEPEDLPHYLTLSKDVGYNCFTLPGMFSVKNDEEALAKIQLRMDLFQKRGLSKFVILKKDTGEFIGTCGMDPYPLNGKDEVELGYRICLNHWGKGYATEVANAVLNYGFNQLRLDKIYAFAVPQNQQSIRIIRKLGFKYIGDFDHVGLPHNLHEITKAQFDALN